MPSLLPKPVTDCLTPDAVIFEVFRHPCAALAEVMGVALGDPMPVYCGSTPTSLQAGLDELGDASFPGAPLYTREGSRDSMRTWLTLLTHQGSLSNMRIPSVSPTIRYAEEAVERGASAGRRPAKGHLPFSDRPGRAPWANAASTLRGELR